MASPQSVRPTSRQPRTASRPFAEGQASGSRMDPAHRVTPFDFNCTLELNSIQAVGERLTCALADAAACDALLAAYEPARRRFRLVGDSRGLEKPRLLSPGDSIEQVLTESVIIATSSEGNCLETTLDLQTPTRVALAQQCGVSEVRACLLAESTGSVQGALIFLQDTTPPADVEKLLRERSTLAQLASYLRLRREAAASWWDRLSASSFAKLRSKWSGWTMAALIIVAVLLITPMPHYVGGTCQCEPATRRIVTAPFDAQLAECFVKPGDRVQAGQLLATFEGIEIASEIESLAAERRQSKQCYDAAIAKSEADVATESLLEIQRLDGKLHLLQARQDRLELRSPIDGVVVSGDLEQSVGASLAVGERLLEIAPLQRMIAEVSIDESDISLVSVGQRVSLRFDGSPYESHDTTLVRIFPRAEVIDGENVYVAECEITGNVEALAPGMRGYAKVHGSWRALGWTLFRKPYLAIRRIGEWY